MTKIVVLVLTHILAFVAGGMVLRNNPVKGARTLAELEALYAAAKAKLQKQ